MPAAVDVRSRRRYSCRRLIGRRSRSESVSAVGRCGRCSQSQSVAVGGVGREVQSADDGAETGGEGSPGGGGGGGGGPRNGAVSSRQNTAAQPSAAWRRRSADSSLASPARRLVAAPYDHLVCRHCVVAGARPGRCNEG